MKKIAAVTFGCKVNQYETSCILDEFIQAGYEVVDFKEPADVYIINSCTVTNRTDQKSRNAVRKALQHKDSIPNTKIVITGCYSQRNQEVIMELGPVDLIVDNNEKSRIFEYIENTNLPGFENLSDLNKKDFDELFTTKMLDHSRAFIKVQDGCDYYCAYCAIPYARGTSRSRKKENVLKQIITLVEQGYHEFVLGGINLGLYGCEEDDGYFFSDLLRDIENIPGVELIRLSSIEPQLFTPDMLKYFQNSKKICPHFHIPLQVGCDELLSAMGRKYSTSEFTKTIQNLKNIFPDCAIGIDVITGLPGETDELFQKTYSFLNSLDITYLHVFSYSRRPGTRAATMSGQVHGTIVKLRSNKLVKLSHQKTELYIQKILDKKIPLRGIIEKRNSEYWSALSDHFVRVYFQSDEQLEKIYLHFLPKSKRFDGIEVDLLKS